MSPYVGVCSKCVFGMAFYMIVGNETKTFDVQGRMNGTSQPSQRGILFRAQAAQL